MAQRRVALVTGGSRGIGLGIAMELAKSGFDLLITGRRPMESVAAAMSELERFGVAARYITSDVADSSAREHLLTEIDTTFGRLDVLVNNAGIAPRVRADILDADEDSFDEIMSVNLKGPYFLTRDVARRMISQRKTDEGFAGCVLNICSISAAVVSTNRGDYCISKAGVAMATRLWATRLAEYNISVFELRPGLIATDMTEGAKAKYDALIEDGLLLEKRWGTPEDVGTAAAMLARGDLPYATGSVLTLDGGLTMSRL
ncbi:MAG TPA: 3-ketoacyl-ACP reductase [Acidisarcina sp.]|nr:3-ketoacyl-ACP reductase [Acidisarcina sp.]